MLNLFFTITFIAQIILTYEIVKFIMKCDSSILELNSSVNEAKPILKDTLKLVRGKVSSVLNSLVCFIALVEEKKQMCKDGITNGAKLATTVFQIAAKIPFSQVISVIELFVRLKKLFKAV